MAISAQFVADFSSFRAAVDGAETRLKAFQSGAAQVERQLTRMGDAFSGRKILQEATIAVKAVTDIGGITKLTANEQARLNATLNEAIQKYAALGQTAPTELTRLASATQGVATSTTRLTASLAEVKSLFGAFGVSLGVAGLVSFGRDLLATGDELVRVADQTGLTTEEVQRFQFIAHQSGNSLDQFTTAVSFLQKSLGATGPEFERTRKSVEALGLDFERFRAAAPFEQMSQLAEAIGKIENPAARARAAFELFGRSGTALLPTLTAQFKALGDSAPVMSDNVARSLDQAGDALNKFGQEIKVFAANSYNFLGRAFDQLIKFDFQVGAAFQRFSASVIDAASKIPGMETALAKLGISSEESRKAAQFLTDAANAQQAALDRVPEPAKRAAVGVAQFGDASETAGKQANAAAIAAKSMADEFKRQMAVANATFESIDTIERTMLENRRRFEEQSASAQERLAQQTAQRQLATFLEFNQSLIGLDAERTRALLAQNAPGSGIFLAATQAGETIGQQISRGIVSAFEDIPHFLISSVLHSGNFLNGLKAIGVQMADAIVGPLIKQFALRLAGARLASIVAGGVAGTAAGAGAGVAASVAATEATIYGGGGAGFGASLAAFATNPITLGIAAAAIGGILLYKHFGHAEERQVNDLRDQFFGQFQQRYGGTQDQSLAKAFAAAHIGGDIAELSIQRLFAAKKLDIFRAEEANTLARLSVGGVRGLKSYEQGGYVPPGDVQLALLHGGQFGETITSGRRQPSFSTTNINFHISTPDVEGFNRLFDTEIAPRVRMELLTNRLGLVTHLNRVLAT